MAAGPVLFFFCFIISAFDLYGKTLFPATADPPKVPATMWPPRPPSTYLFFCLIILAFSLCKTMAANYTKPYPVCRAEGSVAATQHPNKEIRETRPRKFVTRTKSLTTQGKQPSHTHATHHPPDKSNPDARSPWVATHRVLLLLSHHSRRCHRPILVAVPIFFHRRRRPPLPHIDRCLTYEIKKGKIEGKDNR